MGDVMLFGVLRMPYEMAMVDELSRRQFWGRAQQAADELITLRAEVERLRAALEWYASDVNWLNPERARAALAQEPTNE